MTIFHSLLLGIVEGITEFFADFSSTAHLALIADLLKIPTTDFSKSFEIIIQFGAILAVVCLYFKSLFNWGNIKKLFVAFLPTAVLGLIFYKIIKSYLLGNAAIMIWALIIGGALFDIFEYFYKRKSRELMT